MKYFLKNVNFETLVHTALIEQVESNIETCLAIEF